MRALALDVPAQQLAVDAVALPLAGAQPLGGAALELDRLLGGLISEVLGAGEHRGRPNEVLPLHTSGRISARRLLLYGVGSGPDLDGQRVRYAHHEMVRAARSYGYRRLGVVCAPPLNAGQVGAVVEGCVMGAWERRSRQTGSRATSLDELQVTGFGSGREDDVAAALQMGEATNRVREWQNLPANELTPEALAGIGREVASRHGLDLEVLGPDELRAGGYRLLLGVAAGSAEPPRLLRLEHRGAGGSGPRLALVGKGITFDSGGLSLKTATGMETMKADMAGAAAVLSALDVIAARRLPLDVMAVVAATENMTGPAAQ
nr:leucyl aminopeptidase [Candidatus Dormibacteraeota bacterium]